MLEALPQPDERLVLDDPDGDGGEKAEGPV